MKILRSMLPPATLACLLLSSPVLESRAQACGGGLSFTPAAEVQWAVSAAMGGDPAAYEVESIRFVAGDRAVVDVRHTAGPRAGRRTRMIARLGEAGWAITGSWTIRPTGPRSRTVAAR